MCEKYKEPVTFVGRKVYMFRVKNNHCKTVAHKIGISATSVLCCVKVDIKVQKS